MIPGPIRSCVGIQVFLIWKTRQPPFAGTWANEHPAAQNRAAPISGSGESSGEARP